MNTHENIAQVSAFYDENARAEWERLKEHPFEFLITTAAMERRIDPGEKILDIGGGPGRYAIHFAKRGCEVTLVDLSQGNISLAREKAREAGVDIRTHVKNCLCLRELELGTFDHVFLMGPLYHLVDDMDRECALREALAHVKPGGTLYVSFIQAFAGVIYDLKNGGFIEKDLAEDAGNRLLDAIEAGENYEGPAFTACCMMHVKNILPFMQRFPLRDIQLMGQEGILAPNEKEILQRPQSEIDAWLSLAQRFCQLPELLSFSEHLMVIARRQTREEEIASIREIINRFAGSGWDVLAPAARAYLDGQGTRETLLRAVREADDQCGKCGCEMDPLHKRVLAAGDVL